MRGLIVTFVLVCSVIVSAQEKASDGSNSGFSRLVLGQQHELDLERENYMLRKALVETKSQLEQAQRRIQLFEAAVLKVDTSADVNDLMARCKALEPKLRDAQKPKTSATFDCSTLEFKESPK